MIEIKDKHFGKILRRVDAAYLYGADLSYADLSYANLSNADLSYANLSYADLSNADLSYADLSNADLSYADLSNANLNGANLRDAELTWLSHDLIAEILRQEAGDDMDKRALAGLVLMSRDRYWNFWKEFEHPEKAWAVEVLRQWEGCPL